MMGPSPPCSNSKAQPKVTGVIVGVLLCVVGIAVCGCGGGGSGGDAPGPSPPGPPGPSPGPPGPAPPGPPPPPPHYWLVCKSMTSCSSDKAGLTESWATDPATVADQVGDASKLPGVDASAWATFAGKWSASPPNFKGSPVKLTDVAGFMKELLSSDPFSTGDKVPYVDFNKKDDGASIAITQRQLAFVVSNVLMGNKLKSAALGDNGLSAALERCAPKHADMLYALLSFLAILSTELADGGDGTVLIATRPKNIDGKAKGSIGWKDRFSNIIKNPNICNKIGDKSSGCTPDDFMTGGTNFQALTDIAGNDVGGGAQLCNIAASQDESLVQFYSEVLAFAFFGDSMVPVPVSFLGVRRYVSTIEGNRERLCGEISTSDWLNSDIENGQTSVPIDAGSDVVHAKMMTSSFVAVKSVCSAAVVGQCSHTDQMNNMCDGQRHHVDEDVDFWYQAFEASFYNTHMQAAFKGVVKRIGTGPWGSGVWWGDSQIYFLTMMLATNALQDVTLDYYMYEKFCENGGNQCFVLGKDGCADCVAMERHEGPGLDSANCGTNGYKDMMKLFEGKTVEDMYNAIMKVGAPPKQCFDTLTNMNMTKVSVTV